MNKIALKTFNRFPVKQAMDLASIAKLFSLPMYSWDQKLAGLKFYFDAGGVRNIYATQGRTGSAWSALVLELALDLAQGGDGDYRFEYGFWIPNGGIRYTKLDWRVPCDTMMTPLRSPHLVDPVFYHTHHPYRRLRCGCMGRMKTVIGVRSILESLESYYFKQIRRNVDILASEEDESSFPWDEYLTEQIAFFNSWGAYAESNPNCLAVTYEQLMEDSINAFQRIATFWGLGIPDSCIETALRRTTKTAMRDKLSDTTRSKEQRVSYRQKRGVLSDGLFRHIIDRLKNELFYDFGYDFSHDHKYGTVYD